VWLVRKKSSTAAAASFLTLSPRELVADTKKRDGPTEELEVRVVSKPPNVKTEGRVKHRGDVTGEHQLERRSVSHGGKKSLVRPPQVVFPEMTEVWMGRSDKGRNLILLRRYGHAVKWICRQRRDIVYTRRVRGRSEYRFDVLIQQVVTEEPLGGGGRNSTCPIRISPRRWAAEPSDKRPSLRG